MPPFSQICIKDNGIFFQKLALWNPFSKCILHFQAPKTPLSCKWMAKNSVVQFLQMHYRICTYFKRIEMYSVYKTLHPFVNALSINESLQLLHFFQCFKKLEPIHCHCITYFPQDKIIVIYTDYLVCRLHLVAPSWASNDCHASDVCIFFHCIFQSMIFCGAQKKVNQVLNHMKVSKLWKKKKNSFVELFQVFDWWRSCMLIL